MNSLKLSTTLILLLLTTSLILGGCTATATPVATQNVLPTETPGVPTTETTTPTEEPTVTPTSEPTATGTQAPTNTPVPTETPTVTPSPTLAGNLFTSGEGGFLLVAPFELEGNVSGSEIKLTGLSNSLEMTFAMLSAQYTSGNNALFSELYNLGSKMDALEEGEAYNVTVSGTQALAVNYIGLRLGEPVAGRLLVADAGGGSWFVAHAEEKESNEGDRFSDKAAALWTSVIESVEFTQ